MLFINKRVKTITTIGPSSDSKEGMLKLASRGANVYRLNFSHGDFQEHGARVKLAREIISEYQRPLSIMLDTKGPEIRTHSFENDAVLIEKNSVINILTNEEVLGNAKEFSVNYQNLIKDVKENSKILIDDGKLQLLVLEVDNKNYKIKCRALNSHKVKNTRAVNVPGVKLSLDFLSKKDKEDLIFGCEELKVDYVAASFVSDASDIKVMRDFLNQHGGQNIKIIAKIESKYAIDNIDEIILHSDGIMIARGDLGVDLPYYEVPLWQKRIIHKCNKEMVPVIVATQMLESMLTNPTPTRAEVSDIYWAVDLGVDSTMLSGESANGEYPDKSMEAMTKVIWKAESHFWYDGYLEKFLKWSKSAFKDFAYQVGKKVLEKRIHQVIIIDNSEDHLLLKTLSNAKIRSTLIPLVNDKDSYSSFGILYGIYPELVNEDINDILNSNEKLIKIAKKFGAKDNQKILIVNGSEIKELDIK